MRILDRIIRNAIITTTLLVSAVIVSIQSFLLLISQSNVIGHGSYSIAKALLYVFMQMPAQLYQLFPIAGFLSTLLALSRLSSTSQLIIMRASGVSIARIMWSVIKTAILMIIVVTVIGEEFGPQWSQQSHVMQRNALSSTQNTLLLESIWLHHGNSFTHIGGLVNHDNMIDIIRYHFSSNGKLKKVTSAKTAHLIHGHWELIEPQETIFDKNHIETQSKKESAFQVAFRPNLQIKMKVAPAGETMKNLYQTILYRKTMGLSVNQYLFSFWQRLLQPITSIVMICLAVPFVFGLSRNTSVGSRTLVATLIGFIFYMLSQLFGPITLVYQFPPLLAAIIPTCFFLLVLITLLLRV